MITNTINAAKIAEQGRRIYREKIQVNVEAEHRGEYLALDVDSGDYSLAPDEETALIEIEQRQPKGRFYLLRVGYVASLFLGSQAA